MPRAAVGTAAGHVTRREVQRASSIVSMSSSLLEESLDCACLSEMAAMGQMGGRYREINFSSVQ